jgi:hypothetical protein
LLKKIVDMIDKDLLRKELASSQQTKVTL